jgi:hypothetical protein
MRTCTALLTFCLVVPAASADGPTPRAAFPDAVRAAVAGRQVEDTGNFAGASYRDVASDGSVLVGLEVGLARWFDRQIPYVVRPIFRKGDHEWAGGTAGSFSSRQVIRVLREVARPGYAVGAMWLRIGAGIDRLCLVYFKITDTGLDPADHYTGPWIGSSDGGNDHFVDGKGRPIVGLTADAERDQARSLGFVLAQVARVPKKVDPKPEPTPTADKVEPKKADPPAAAEAGSPKKSKLEEENPPEEEEEDNSLLLILLAAAVIVGAPLGIFAIISLTKPTPLPDDLDDERPRRRARRPEPESPRPPDEHLDRESPRQPEEQSAPVTAKTERPELARRLAPFVPPMPAPAATIGTDASYGKAPPYFLVRATYRSRHLRMSRIYVLPTEILMIDCGAGADVNEAAGVAAAVLSGGGAIGAFIGGAVGGMVADAGKAKGEAIQERLNRLDLQGLLDLAGAHGNLRAGVSDLVGESIDQPNVSGWRGQPSRAVGTFRFRFLGRGEYTFEFLNGAEIRCAVELLRGVLGSAMHVGQSWDEATAVYLRGL